MPTAPHRANATIAINFTDEHETPNGPGCYCTMHDGATGRRLGRLHVIQTPQGPEYRDFATDALLSVQSSAEAIQAAITIDQSRRAALPSRRQPRQDGAERRHAPRRTPIPLRVVSPARRELVRRLQARYAAGKAAV